ncbi:DsbC family protein [Burkholderia multivorans]|uniref:DsbC family protein n=1 Tax=Burkholderia multivorans TaxID=87883 RepID=UPI001C22B9CD|nr:DsbC family protein [Burkholderia multivorans]MBU9211633.1 DsbC family protein [Burkholderia multivorans]
MRKLVVSIIAFAAASVVYAGTGDVEKRLKDQYPSTKITEVRESAIKGLYEVVMGRNVAYTDESGRYMIFGHLYDMKEQKDLTAQRLDEINKIDVSALPLADAIKTVKGDGSRTLYVFSDPDCPFCQRLEAELAKMDNVTIYTLLYPLEGLHPDARRKAEAIWCAKDRAKAWEEFMANGKLPDASGCETPIDRNLRLGNTLGVNGTPTIIFADGAIAPGMLPATEIERRLSGGGRPVGGAVQRQ